MQENQLYFLMVAEELNITRAAQKAFISQQCMSNHIKRLEEAYSTRLFNRRPKLSLTPAGELLAQTLRQIKRLEDNLRSQLSEENFNFGGKINLGITWSRSSILLPPVLTQYRKLYPNIEIIVQNNVTDNLENRLLCGYLDLAVGTGAINSPEIEVKPLSRERVFLAVSDHLLEQLFPGGYPACKERFRSGVDLADFAACPFILNTPQERFFDLLTDMLDQQGLKLNVVFQSDSSDIRSQLCGADLGASLFSELLLQYVIRQNKLQPADNQLNIYPVNGEFPDYWMIAFYHKKAFQPQYLKVFIEMLAEQAKRCCACAGGR
ncbi:LysR family transcriptional regulator [Pseudoflavonifractor sp. BIOML-A6]|jgi:transcriptional regulator|nr:MULTISPECIES: LysR family transcriptional regulator [unclassified Pseudoflavonifractor]MTQ95651.1 LysR family transcriptional regulator [Pseudoflavonifractor sp. BIOML-A16]MTR06033.1 LysR family transcriptional regulator [Pseudoflavonifractor sp. BIOML-A15]MTR32091.1 LysR family transcriptional regulator [Pseudoflavonifractor sp. BIOML-A14]MTR73075.1 LysR family transcriptional regulator [Pseudoflavonifractor sp. BIOML-A18]MTS63702.1 LysR family transcriptional regulator [Pseudoflavonifract